MNIQRNTSYDLGDLGNRVLTHKLYYIYKPNSEPSEQCLLNPGWLVGDRTTKYIPGITTIPDWWFRTFFFFHILGIIIPTTNIFQRGWNHQPDSLGESLLSKQQNGMPEGFGTPQKCASTCVNLAIPTCTSQHVPTILTVCLMLQPAGCGRSEECLGHRCGHLRGTTDRKDGVELGWFQHNWSMLVLNINMS